MSETRIRSERHLPALVHLEELEWTPSPMPGVARKMLERVGEEVALATTVVKYDPESHFSSHTHEKGEEFLVLEGIFSDEHGDYPVGTYIRNPPGSSHAPFSKEGCTIFVKLRYMKPTETERVLIHPHGAPWREIGEGWTSLLMFCDPAGDETVTLEQLSAGATLSWELGQGGVEILVVEGSCEDENQRYTTGSWLRLPKSGMWQLQSPEGCLLWAKRHHLPAA